MSATLAMMALTPDEAAALAELAELNGVALLVYRPANLVLGLSDPGEDTWLPIIPDNDWAIAAVQNLRTAAEERAAAIASQRATAEARAAAVRSQRPYVRDQAQEEADRQTARRHQAARTGLVQAVRRAAQKSSDPLSARGKSE